MPKKSKTKKKPHVEPENIDFLYKKDKEYGILWRRTNKAGKITAQHIYRGKILKRDVNEDNEKIYYVKWNNWADKYNEWVLEQFVDTHHPESADDSSLTTDTENLGEKKSESKIKNKTIKPATKRKNQNQLTTDSDSQMPSPNKFFLKTTQEANFIAEKVQSKSNNKDVNNSKNIIKTKGPLFTQSENQAPTNDLTTTEESTTDEIVSQITSGDAAEESKDQDVGNNEKPEKKTEENNDKAYRTGCLTTYQTCSSLYQQSNQSLLDLKLDQADQTRFVNFPLGENASIRANPELNLIRTNISEDDKQKLLVNTDITDLVIPIIDTILYNRKTWPKNCFESIQLKNFEKITTVKKFLLNTYQSNNLKTLNHLVENCTNKGIDSVLHLLVFKGSHPSFYESWDFMFRPIDKENVMTMTDQTLPKNKNLKSDMSKLFEKIDQECNSINNITKVTDPPEYPEILRENFGNDHILGQVPKSPRAKKKLEKQLSEAREEYNSAYKELNEKNLRVFYLLMANRYLQRNKFDQRIWNTYSGENLVDSKTEKEQHHLRKSKMLWTRRIIQTIDNNLDQKERVENLKMDFSDEEIDKIYRIEIGHFSFSGFEMKLGLTRNFRENDFRDS